MLSDVCTFYTQFLERKRDTNVKYKNETRNKFKNINKK